MAIFVEIDVILAMSIVLRLARYQVTSLSYSQSILSDSDF